MAKEKAKPTEDFKEKHHMKRWEIYTLIALVAVIIGGGIFGAYYYVENVMNEPEVTGENTNVTRTEEEKELDQIKADLVSDDALDTADVEAEINDLESIDLSGL